MPNLQMPQFSQMHQNYMNQSMQPWQNMYMNEPPPGQFMPMQS